jgi:hypothetical protein
LLYSPLSHADKCWTWEGSATEKGYFITDDGADVGSGITNYIINTFKVTTTSVSGVDSSTAIAIAAPTSGFKWDGSAPTEFWRSGGTYTNGSNFLYTGATPNIRWTMSINFFRIADDLTQYASNSNTPTLAMDATGAACGLGGVPAPIPASILDFNQPTVIFSKEISVTE